MKKHLSRTLALLLVVAMVLTLLPMAVFATNKGEKATLINGAPEDGTYGVIYSCGEGYSHVLGYDIDSKTGDAASVATTLDGTSLTLEEGTAVIKFVKNADGSYYFMLGNKYLVMKDTAASTEDLVLCSTAEAGAKWSIIADQAGGEGMFNIKSEYKYNGKYDVYLEQYNGTKFCGYSYKSETPQYFQFKFFSCSADEDGRIGDVANAGALPADGDKVVIYNDYAKACFGQEQSGEAPNILPAFSTLTGETLSYENIGNGAQIFTVHYDGSKYYTFECNGKFLSTPENKLNEAGKTVNDETIFMADAQSEYTKWELTPVSGGYVMYNKTAKYFSSSVCIEFFNEVFSGWSYSATNNAYFAMNFYKVTDKYNCGYVVNPTVNFGDVKANLGMPCEVAFTVDDIPGIQTISATYWCDNASATAKTAKLTPDASVAQKYSLTVPAADLEGRSKLNVKVDMTDKIGASCSKILTVEIANEVLITAVNPAPNTATGSVSRPAIYATFVNAGSNQTVVMTVDGTTVKPTIENGKATYTPSADMTKSKHTIAVKVTRSDGKYAEKTWSFYIGEMGIAAYFGQFHSHTAEYSDGAGLLEDAYEHAYAAKDVDFLIVTDHSNYFDTTSTAAKKSYYDLSTLSKAADGTTTKWEEARATAASYNEKYDGQLVCAYGYEMTWSGGPGHTNSFNTYGPISRNNGELNNKTNYSGMFLYNDLMYNANVGRDIDGNAVAEDVKTKYIDDAPIVSQFNHPGTTFGTFGDFTGYTATRDTVLNLIEVGNGEGAVGGSSYWPSYEQYDKCLAMGWHVAPTNNQDNHKGKWGDANTCRDVILTDDFTEAGLYKAMAARHVYATEDQNFQMFYYLNVDGTDYLQGDIASIDGNAQPTTVTVKASLNDPDGEGLGKVQIIGENGKVLATETISGSSYELKKTITNNNAYYYIKVIQKDGDIAVSAPVWTNTAVPVNVSVDTDCAVPIENVEENIKASILNGDETESIVVTQYTVTIDEEKLVTKTVKETVEPGKSYDITVPFTPKNAEYYKITVEFTFTYKGKTYTYDASMGETAMDKDDVVYVGIDRGHDNYYVSGDYADTTSNMIQFCANNRVVCEFIDAGELFFNNIKKYEVVFLTVNYRRNAAKALNYTDRELYALRKYVENGGKVVICSKSDRDNKFDNCADNTNKLLEAIGAHTRIVNGIIVDNDLKANEAYRLYFSSIDCFNVMHRFTKGTYTASNAYGTTPATANQTGFQFYNGAPVEIMDGYENSVQVLIKGYDSTWASHYDGYFTGSSFVPEYDGTAEHVTVDKGDVNVMTYEDTDEGGWIITSGVTFFSDYDIKDDVEYANKYILRNILNDLTGSYDKYKVSEISTVKKQTSGEYSIEGFVTSNASAYDQDTAFFDCIYIQDKAGNGINVFPVAGNYAIGMHVQCHGAITFYCGEVELNLSEDNHGQIRVVDDEIYTAIPKKVSCTTAMANATIGNLVMTQGIVVSIHKTAGVVDKIYLNDGQGEACLFINGYIMKDDTSLDAIRVGMEVSGIGIGSRDVDETSATGAIFSRLRVRDRGEIQIVDPEIDINAVFKDISKSAWYNEYVEYVVGAGYLNGTSHTTFAPNASLTRAMVATVLFRMAGEPSATATKEFKDVEDGKWYSEAVAWAQANEIVLGYEDGTFRPNKNITRQEMTVMLTRFAKNVAKLDTTPVGGFGKLTDGYKVATWARDSMVWCINNGIIAGNEYNKILPQDLATRAQFAAIVTRLDKMIKSA